MADLTKDAIELLLSTGKGQAEPIEREYEGRKYINKELKPVETPMLTALKISTLSSLVELCRGKFKGDAAFEKFDAQGHVVHVVSERHVQVVTAFSNEWKDREVLIDCNLSETTGMQFNEFLPQEQFIIGLLSAFNGEGDREGLAKLAGNATAEHVSTAVDDGVTQVISMRMGAKVNNEDGTAVVKGLVRLAPWRTFREVAQPLSNFLFRVQKVGDQAQFALFEADGGAWKLEAIANIARLLSAGLTTATVVS